MSQVPCYHKKNLTIPELSTGHLNRHCNYGDCNSENYAWIFFSYMKKYTHGINIRFFFQSVTSYRHNTENLNERFPWRTWLIGTIKETSRPLHRMHGGTSRMSLRFAWVLVVFHPSSISKSQKLAFNNLQVPVKLTNVKWADYNRSLRSHTHFLIGFFWRFCLKCQVYSGNMDNQSISSFFCRLNPFIFKKIKQYCKYFYTVLKYTIK